MTLRSLWLLLEGEKLESKAIFWPRGDYSVGQRGSRCSRQRQSDSGCTLQLRVKEFVEGLTVQFGRECLVMPGRLPLAARGMMGRLGLQQDEVGTFLSTDIIKC